MSAKATVKKCQKANSKSFILGDVRAAAGRERVAQALGEGRAALPGAVERGRGALLPRARGAASGSGLRRTDRPVKPFLVFLSGNVSFQNFKNFRRRSNLSSSLECSHLSITLRSH